jgi:hypothetical protein
VRIRYTGTYTERVWGSYRFDASNGKTCTIEDGQTIQEMLTTGGFVVADDDALAQAVGAEQAGELTLQGVFTPEAYHGLKRQRDPTHSKKEFQEFIGHTTDRDADAELGGPRRLPGLTGE